MTRTITFAQAQTHWDSLLPRDESRSEAQHERLCEAIDSDPERLLAAVYETDCDEAEKLAKLRIVLYQASVTLRAVVNQGIEPMARFEVMFNLLDAAKEADAIVTEKIKQAADKEVS